MIFSYCSRAAGSSATPGPPSCAPKMPGVDALTNAERFARRPKRIESQRSLLGACGFVGVWIGKGREVPIQINPYFQGHVPSAIALPSAMLPYGLSYTYP